jgi:hypothetical protein
MDRAQADEVAAVADALGAKGMAAERAVLFAAIERGSDELSLEDTGALLRKSAETVLRWIELGGLEARVGPAGEQRVPLEAVLPLLRLRALTAGPAVAMTPLSPAEFAAQIEAGQARMRAAGQPPAADGER